jgi:hypothetical protein
MLKSQLQPRLISHNARATKAKPTIANAKLEKTRIKGSELVVSCSASSCLYGQEILVLICLMAELQAFLTYHEGGILESKYGSLLGLYRHSLLIDAAKLTLHLFHLTPV